MSFKRVNNGKQWIVVLKDGKWNAAINNHRNTVQQLEAQGWEIMGEPYFKEKRDAIDWVKYCHANAPKKRKRKR